VASDRFLIGQQGTDGGSSRGRRSEPSRGGCRYECEPMVLPGKASGRGVGGVIAPLDFPPQKKEWYDFA
jgi:hypothetical protein